MQKQKLLREFSCFTLIRVLFVGENRTIHLEEAKPEDSLKSPTGSPRPEDLEALQKKGAFATAPEFAKLAKLEQEASDPISILKRQFDREALRNGLKETLGPLGKSFLNAFEENVHTLEDAARYIEPHFRNANVEVQSAAQEAKDQIVMYGLAFEPEILPIVVAALYEKIGPLLGITPRDVKNGTALSNSDEYVASNPFWPFKNAFERADYSIKKIFVGAPDYVTSDERAQKVLKASLASLENAEQRTPEIATRVVDEFVHGFGTVWGTINAELAVASRVAPQVKPASAPAAPPAAAPAPAAPLSKLPAQPVQPEKSAYVLGNEATARLIREAADPKNRPTDQIKHLWAFVQDVTDPAEKVVPADKITELRVKPGKTTFVRDDKGNNVGRLTSGFILSAVGDEKHLPYGTNGIRYVKVHYKDEDGYDRNGWVSWKNVEPKEPRLGPQPRDTRPNS